MSASAGPVRLGLVGATGRMGGRVLRLLPEHPALQLAAALGSPRRRAAPPSLPAGCAWHADPAQFVAGSPAGCAWHADPAQFVAGLDVVLDFSAPPQVASLAPLCAAAGAAYVVAATNLDAVDHRALAQAARAVPVLEAANMSLGVDVLLQAVAAAAARLQAWDIEIVEVHHRHKVDGPSGTARLLGEAAQAGGPRPAVLDRHAERGGRAHGTLGYSVVRGGDVAGEHTVLFLGEGERIELVHRSQSADIFARGALNACARVGQLGPGRWRLRDVLGGA